MESLIFRGRADARNACDQWTLITDADDGVEFVLQERMALDALRSGQPYLRLIRRMTVPEFFGTAQPAMVKRALQNLLDSRDASRR